MSSYAIFKSSCSMSILSSPSSSLSSNGSNDTYPIMPPIRGGFRNVHETTTATHFHRGGYRLELVRIADHSNWIPLYSARLFRDAILIREDTILAKSLKEVRETFTWNWVEEHQRATDEIRYKIISSTEDFEFLVGYAATRT